MGNRNLIVRSRAGQREMKQANEITCCTERNRPCNCLWWRGSPRLVFTCVCHLKSEPPSHTTMPSSTSSLPPQRPRDPHYLSPVDISFIDQTMVSSLVTHPQLLFHRSLLSKGGRMVIVILPVCRESPLSCRPPTSLWHSDSSNKWATELCLWCGGLKVLIHSHDEGGPQHREWQSTVITVHPHSSNWSLSSSFSSVF